MTELFFRNTLSEFEPAEIAAGSGKCVEPTLTDRVCIVLPILIRDASS